MPPGKINRLQGAGPCPVHGALQLLRDTSSWFRHQRAKRSEHYRTLSQQPSDDSGSDLKPNPGAARTPAEFIAALWRYKAWSGDPSWRRMAARAGQEIVHSTMYAAMNGAVLPKFEVVRAIIIIGCGGSDEDLDSFTRAWREIMTRQIKTSIIDSSRRAGPGHQR
jgi:hypothetical protein